MSGGGGLAYANMLYATTEAFTFTQFGHTLYTVHVGAAIERQREQSAYKRIGIPPEPFARDCNIERVGSYHGRSAGDGAARAPPAGVVVAVDRGTVCRLRVQLTHAGTTAAVFGRETHR